MKPILKATKRNCPLLVSVVIVAMIITFNYSYSAMLKTPVYAGEVSRITNPIKLQYRPFGNATLNKLTDTKYTVDGKSQSVKAPISGTYSATTFGEGLKVVLSAGQGAKKAIFEYKIYI